MLDQRWRRGVVCGLLVTAAAVPAVRSADYVAYAETKKGEVPLPEDVVSITKENAKDLVEVRWGEYEGKRVRVGVLEADNRSTGSTFRVDGPSGSYTWSASSNLEQVPVNGIDAILTDVLAQTGRFTVLERVELDAVLGEQDLGAGGRVAAPSAAKTGQVLGAQYLIQVVVNSYEPGVSKKRGGLGGLSRKLRGLGGIAAGKEKSYVSMTFKLIDAETSAVAASQVVEATISDLKLSFGAVGWGRAGALGGFFSSYSKTPIGQAVIAAVNAGVFEIVKQVGNVPLAGAVVKVDGSEVILNLGADQVGVGDELKAVARGEALVDPETGVVLASNDEEIGRLRITRVAEKVSYAEPVGFEASRLARGDRVVSTAPAAPLKFGPAW